MSPIGKMIKVGSILDENNRPTNSRNIFFINVIEKYVHEKTFDIRQACSIESAGKYFITNESYQ